MEIHALPEFLRKDDKVQEANDCIKESFLELFNNAYDASTEKIMEHISDLPHLIVNPFKTQMRVATAGLIKEAFDEAYLEFINKVED